MASTSASLRRHPGSFKRRHHCIFDRLPLAQPGNRPRLSRRQRAIGSPPRIGSVTANLNVSYLKPTPLGETLELRARIDKLERRKIWVSCSLTAVGELRATGTVLGVRVNWE